MPAMISKILNIVNKQSKYYGGELISNISVGCLKRERTDLAQGTLFLGWCQDVGAIALKTRLGVRIRETRGLARIFAVETCFELVCKVGKGELVLVDVYFVEVVGVLALFLCVRVALVRLLYADNCCASPDLLWPSASMSSSSSPPGA